MDNDNGGKIGGRAGIPEGIRRDVDRLLSEVFYSDGSIRDRLKAIEEKLNTLASTTDVSNIKWDLLKILLPTIIALLALLFAVLRWADTTS